MPGTVRCSSRWSRARLGYAPSWPGGGRNAGRRARRHPVGPGPRPHPRPGGARRARTRAPRRPPTPPAPGEHLRAAHLMAALAARIPAETVVVEETPSSRPDLHRLLPARAPLGFLSAAMGGLGFALPAAIGVRMAAPRRPVVAVVGDGSALYQVQALWSAAHYGVGVLVVVLANGRYAIMDRLAEGHAGDAPWPAFPEIRLAAVAAGLGCPSLAVVDAAALQRVLDDVVPGLARRTEPLLVEVAVEADR